MPTTIETRRKPLPAALALTALCCWLTVTSAPALAGSSPLEDLEGQSVLGRGFDPTKAYEFSEIDSVNLFNGQLTLRIPLGPRYPQDGGGGFGLTLVYDSNLWDFKTWSSNEISWTGTLPPPQDHCAQYTQKWPTWTSNAGLGWRLSLGRLFAPGDEVGVSDQGVDGVQVNSGKPSTLLWRYDAPDGSSHEFHDNLPFPGGPTAGGGGFPKFSRDGSYMRLDCEADLLTCTVESPGGGHTVFEREPTFPGGNAYRPVRIEDAFGNAVDVVTANCGIGRTCWHITQHVLGPDNIPHERQITVRFASPDWLFPQVDGVYPFGYRFLERITLPAPAGAAGPRTMAIDFEYFDGTGEVPVFLNHHGGRDNYPYGQTQQRPGDHRLALGLLKAIKLPGAGGDPASDPERYEFEYNAEGSYELAKARLPTGGWVRWGWNTYFFPATRACADETGIPIPQEWENCSLDVQAAESSNPGVVLRRFYDPFNPTNVDDPFDPESEFRQGEWNYYHRLDFEPVVDCGEGGNEVREAQTEVVDPHGHRTVHYFSVYTNADHQNPPPASEGWRRSEFGLPFTRYQRLASTPEGVEQFLSRETFFCEPASGAPDRGPERPSYCKLVRRDYTQHDLIFDGACDGPDFPNTIRSPECRALNPVVQARRTEQRDGATLVSYDGERLTQWDDLGHFRHSKSSGNFCPTGSGNPRTPSCAGDVVERHTQYDSPVPGNQDPWLLGLFSERWVKEGSRTEKETFEFDYGNGFLERHRRFANTAGTPAPTAGDVLTENVPQVVGNRVTGNVKEERVTGGDLVAAGSSTPEYLTTHSYAYGVRASSQARRPQGGALVLSLADRTIDPDTGVVIREVDASGVGLSYRHDGAGRLNEVDPDGPTERTTTISYCIAETGCNTGDLGATRVEVAAGSGTERIARRVAFDGFGRTWRDRRLLPDGRFSLSETRYHADGTVRQERVTPCPGCNVIKTDYAFYDAFGRPRRINLPGHTPEDQHQIRHHWDGTSHLEISHSQVARKRGNDLDLVLGRRFQHFDRMGRLWRVEEYAAGQLGSDANLRETLYRHDLAGRLAAVKSFDGPDATCDVACQERAFLYDGRGFLRAERHPELTGDLPFAGGVWDVVYAAQDSRGNVLAKEDGRIDLAYRYDAAGRLISVRDEVAGRPVQAHFFATRNRNAEGDWVSGGGADRVRGKLFQSKQFHYLDLGPGSPTQTVAATESFRYRGLNGRLSDFSVRTFSDQGAGSPAFPALRFVTGYDHDPLGHLSRIDQPQCEGTDACPPGPARSVAKVYTHGWLTRVHEVGGADYASDISYHDTGLFETIVHGNGAEVEQGYDPRSGDRTGRISVDNLVDPADVWDSGPYSYDDAGNVYRIGAGAGDEFLYDDVDRLVEARIRSLKGGLAAQRYSFDVYGNLGSLHDDDDVFPGNGSPGEHNEFFPIDRATNRLANAAYDAGGNVSQHLLGNLGNVTWDPLGRLVAATGTGANRRHLYTASGERIATVDLQGGSCTPGDVCAAETWTIRGPGQKVLREYRRFTSTGQWTTRDYVYRGGSLLAAETPAGTRYFHLDHLGSPRLVTARSLTGAVKVAEHVYFPFGREATARLQEDERMKFTGHERDFGREGLGPGEPESEQDDLDYMHARYNTPWVGRFLSVDAVPGVKELPQSWNRYAYTRGNPMRLVDPDGRAPADLRMFQQSAERVEYPVPSSPEGFILSAPAGHQPGPSPGGLVWEIGMVANPDGTEQFVVGLRAHGGTTLIGGPSVDTLDESPPPMEVSANVVVRLGPVSYQAGTDNGPNVASAGAVAVRAEVEARAATPKTSILRTTYETLHRGLLNALNNVVCGGKPTCVFYQAADPESDHRE